MAIHLQSYRRFPIRRLGILALAAILVLAGCDSGGVSDDPPDRPRATSDALGILSIFVVDEEGTPLETVETIDPATVLYDIRQPNNAVTDPAGQPLTWDEYNNVKGNVTVECVEGGTRFTVKLSGLIPGGLYTIWNVVLEEPGFGGTLESLLGSIVGVAPLGAPDGSENAFRASEDGTARITEVTPGGSVLQFPDVDENWPDKRGIETCALNEFELHVVGDYHYDGKTHGNIPGPAGTHVEQFGFVFKE